MFVSRIATRRDIKNFKLFHFFFPTRSSQLATKYEILSSHSASPSLRTYADTARTNEHNVDECEAAVTSRMAFTITEHRSANGEKDER